jgi:hypothetical protein
VPRREFVKAAAVAVVGGPAFLAACSGKSPLSFANRSSSSTGSSSTGSSSSTGGSSSSSGGGAGEPNVFRRSARHSRKPCNACVAHAKNRFYATAEAAANDPAHAGCRCSVRGQAIADSQLASMFKSGDTVFDKRSG